MDRVQEEHDNLTSRGGFRVLVVAHGRVEGSFSVENPELPPLELLGLVGFIDPIRPDVPDAIRRCRSAGVDVVMVTGGDHPATALAIARELEITDSPDEVVTGVKLGDPEVATLSEFIDRVKKGRVFARVTRCRNSGSSRPTGRAGGSSSRSPGGTGGSTTRRRSGARTSGGSRWVPGPTSPRIRRR